MALDLEDLEKRLDDALAKETEESLRKWLGKWRELTPEEVEARRCKAKEYIA